MPEQTLANQTPNQTGVATVVSNTCLCPDHYRLTLRLQHLPSAEPGQFVRITPPFDHAENGGYVEREWPAVGAERSPSDGEERCLPFLPRAFSIGGLRRSQAGCDIDIIHRVVGVGTRWLQSLDPGAQVNVLGPLGHPFPVSATKAQAWLVIGGVGLPPLLWLAAALNRAGKQAVAFFGARTADLVPLDTGNRPAPDSKAATARPCAAEFAAVNTPVVISTDDGSLGFGGNVVRAMAQYHAAHAVPTDQLVVYACGPERMMRAAAEFCLARDIECHVCLERAMACGLGTCQSCVVKVKSEGPADGWRYALCCTDGPVFNARSLIWEGPKQEER